MDPTFQPGCYVFGFTIPGFGYFGNTRTYPQQAIFGTRPFGWEIPGKNTEDDVFQFIYGSKNPKTPYRYKGAWKTSTSPWPVTPSMCVRHRGSWAKRVVFYVWRGKQMVRRYRPYDGAPKDHLVPFQAKLIDATSRWQLLSAEGKRQLNSEAARLGLHYAGYHYFTKLYIEDNPKWSIYV